MAVARSEGTVRGAALRMLGDAREDPLAKLPVAAFNAAVAASGDPRRAGRAVAESWARMNPSVARDLAGDPAGLLALCAREFYPFLLDDVAVSRVVDVERDRARIRLDGGLDPEFKAGLLEGFASLAGVRANAREAHGAFDVEWTAAAPARTNVFTALVAVARPPFLAATLVPFLVGTAVAFAAGSFDPTWFALALAGALLVHVGTNAANDYFDHASGTDRAEPEFFTGGTRPIRRGVASPAFVASVAVFAFTAAAALGLFLAWTRGPGVLWLGLAGFALGLFYTTPPVALASRGLGTVAAAVGFGPVMVLGVYYVQTGSFALAPLLASLPIAALVAALLLLNEMHGRAVDEAAGRRTLAVRFGPRAAKLGFYTLVAGAFAVLAAGVAAGAMPKPVLLALVAAPAVFVAARDLPAERWAVAMHLAAGTLLAIGYVVKGVVP